ncbi:MAG: rhomboid family intramembrane serine protease [Acidimicrobiales bacterium]
MTPASVGFHCPDCLKGATKRSPVLRFNELRASRPIITEILIALNVLGLVAVVATGGSLFGGGGTATDRGMLIGSGGVASYGSKGFSVEYIGVAHGEWWRIVTGGFLHSGIVHLGMNMLLLYMLGSQLEPLLGKVRFLSLYIACLVAGSFGVLLVSPNSATVGASGAVFGLMGAAVIAQRRAGIDVWRSGIGGLVAINLLLTFAVPGISIGGHIGGLVAGVAVGAIVFALDRAVQSEWAGTAACMAITLVLWGGCLWAAAR